MMQEHLKVKKPPKAFWTFIIILVVLGATYGLWYFIYAPDAESVFWATMDDNLSSQSVILETDIGFELPTGQTKILLKDQFELGFAAENINSKLKQQILVYDKELSEYYVDPLQEQYFQQLGITENVPPEQWYEQNSYVFNDEDVYLQHDIYTQPVFANWRQLNTTDQSPLPWGEQWYKLSNLDRYQRFLMSAIAQNGFLYGNIEPQKRAEILEILKQTYEVDFDKVISIDRGGRSFYQYDVRLNYDYFDLAFVKYFNALTQDPKQKLKLPGQGDRYFAPKDITYTITIDKSARQIVQIEHPFIIYPFDLGTQPDEWPFLYFPLFGEEFVAVPYVTSLILNSVSNLNFPLQVTTRVAGQNLRLDLRPPASIPPLYGQSARREWV